MQDAFIDIFYAVSGKDYFCLLPAGSAFSRNFGTCGSPQGMLPLHFRGLRATSYLLLSSPPPRYLLSKCAQRHNNRTVLLKWAFLGHSPEIRLAQGSIDLIMPILFRDADCNGTYKSYCDPTREYTNITSILTGAGSSYLLNPMRRYWKNPGGDDEDLWAHEWAKYGTCVITLEPNCYSE